MQVKFGVALTFLLMVVLVIGCAENHYVDENLKIDVQRLDSDLEDRWSTNGVVVRRIEEDSPAKGKLKEGELITHVVGRFDAQQDQNVKKALKRALKDDRSALLFLADGRKLEIGIRKKGEDLGLKLDGARIVVVEPGKAAALAGLKEGGRIVAIVDEKRITSIKEYRKAVDEIREYADSVTFYTDELSVIKLAAIQSLGTLGDIRALPPLIKVLQSGDMELRQPAARALEELSAKVNEPELIGVMIEHLKDPDAEIRRSSAAVLGRLQVVKAIPDLIVALEDPIPGVRFRSGLALSQIGEPALDALITVLRGDNENVREIAASSLGDIGGPKARMALTEELNKKDGLSLQLTIVDALGKMAKQNDRRALDALTRVAQSATDMGLQVFVNELLTRLQRAGN